MSRDRITPKLPSKPPSTPPKTASGEHPAVQAMRAKFESFEDHELANLRALTERAQRLGDRVPDPRRDGDSDPPVDVIRPEDLPTPIPESKKRSPKDPPKPAHPPRRGGS